MSAEFQLKSFTVTQQESAFKVGTDGCLLGAWVDLTGVEKVLELGAGTGLISLMIAQRSNAEITALEIHSESASEAELNFNKSPWRDQLKSIHADARNFDTEKGFDLIISNPPFFRNAIAAKNEHRSRARHQSDLSFEDIIQLGENLLKNSGKIALVIPVSEFSILKDLLVNSNLKVTRQAELRPMPNKEPHRLLLEISCNQKVVSREEFAIELERGQYSARAHELLKDFLLKL